MSITLLQSNAGGVGTGGGSGAGNSTTAVGFTTETSYSSLLICVVFVTGQATIPNPPVTSGVTWNLVASEGYTDGSLLGAVGIYASYDSPNVMTSTTTQILIGTNPAVEVEFDLYEFQGPITSPLDVTAVATGPATGSVIKNPTAVNQTGPYTSGHAGWQGYLPCLINPRGSLSAGSYVCGIDDYFTGDASWVYVNTFGLGIPGTAAIAGVKVTFQGLAYVSSGADPSPVGVTVSLQDTAGHNIGTAKTQSFGGSTSPNTYPLGSDTDTWGASLSPSVVNASGFGVAFQQIGSHSTDRTPVIANCKIQVWYSDPAAPTGTANLSTTSVDLIFVAGQGSSDSGGFASAGSGFTLGIETTLANYGESQYILNQPAGSVPTAFASPIGGSQWCCAAASFKATPTSNTATPTGVSMTTALGPTEPGVPIDYGNVVGTSSGLPPGVNSTYFYVRWVGWLTPSISGQYTVGLNYSDGADFYIGSQPIVTDLTGSQIANPEDPSIGIPSYVTSSSIYLVKNVAYPVVIEWQHGGGADYELQFLWTPPSSTNGPPGEVQVIPEANISLTGSWWNGSETSWYPTVWY